MASVDEEAMVAMILHLAACRAPGVSFCPSEAARALAADWRPLMPALRRVASQLAAEGRIVATQGGRVVDAANAKGPIRLRRTGEPDGD